MAGSSTSGQVAHVLRQYVRPGFMVIFAAIGCLALVLFTFVHWAERQVLTPDNWTAMVAPFPQNNEVANTLSNYVTTNLFNNVPIKQQLEQALPPRAAFLASPLVSQLQTLTTNLTHKAITSDKFEQLWTNVNKAAMTRLVTNARNPNPPSGGRLDQIFSLNLSGVKNMISERLGTASAALPALNPQSGALLDIRTNLQAKRQQVWSYIRKIDFLSATLPFILVFSLLGALALSQNRRRTALFLAIATIILLLFELILLKAARQSVLNQVHNSGYRPAVGYVFDSLVQPLHGIIYTWLLIGMAVSIVCAVASSAGWAVRIRLRLTHSFPFMPGLMHEWHTLRAWIRRYRVGLWCTIGALLLVWLAFLADITYSQTTRGILVAAILVELVFILAHPRRQIV